MKTEQQQKLRMYHAVAGYCNESRSLFRPFPEFDLVLQCFNALLSSIDALLVQEAQVTTGRNVHAFEERRIICAQAADIGAMMVIYAEHAQDEALKARVSHSFRSLRRCEDKRLVKYCRDIHAAGVKYSYVMEQYGLPKEVFDILAGTIEMFNTVVPPPKKAGELKKDYRQRFDFLMQQATVLLKTKLDVLAKALTVINPEMYNDYVEMRGLKSKKGVEQAA